MSSGCYYRVQVQKVKQGKCRCACGNLATTVKQGDYVCERCSEIESRIESYHKHENRDPHRRL
jgi:Zn finger protein HypA/HybF involved in hydrogenase expression